MLKIPSITKDEIIRIAKVSPEIVSERGTCALVARLLKEGRYQDATEDDLEEFENVVC